MEILEICGKTPLYGSVRAQGAKNSVLPILAASMLCADESEIENCPNLSDVDVALDILSCLGCKTEFKNGVAYIDAAPATDVHIPDGLMREMRSSVIFLGAVTARFGEAEIYLPGGCKLGPRPIDLHLEALKRLGAEIKIDGGKISCRAKKLRGAAINFKSVSVGATENAMIAASAAEGETIITNAAREPEIVDLQNFLNKMGAEVRGAGSNIIKIRGKSELHGAKHSIIPDRITTATVLCAAAACGGRAEVYNCEPKNLASVTNILGEMGCGIEQGKDWIRLHSRARLRAAKPIKTEAYPGVPTDAQPLLMAASLTAEGTSVFVENIFESRFAHVSELKRMGADIITSGKTAAVTGVRRLTAAEVEAPDLRGGAALMIAAMNADGVSRIFGTQYINRGYEAPEEVFSSLGAQISRKEVSTAEPQKI